MSSSSITVSDPKVLDFFTRNPSINPDVLFATMIDFYEYVLSSVTHGNTNQILSYVVENSSKMETMKTEFNHALSSLKSILESNHSSTHSVLLERLEQSKSELDSIKSFQSLSNTSLQNEMSSIRDMVSKLNTDITSNVVSKFFDLRTSYIDEIKHIIFRYDTENTHKLKDLLQSHNKSLIESTQSLLKDTLPSHHTQTQQLLSQFQQALLSETQSLLASLNPQTIHSSLDTFTTSMTTKFSDLITNIHQPLFSVINSTEDRLHNSLVQLKELSDSNTTNTQAMNQDLTAFLNKFKNSSFKGQLGENLLYNLLNQAFPTAEIVDSTSDGHSGDFRVKRASKHDVLIENKDYQRNVSPDELDKFIRDIDHQNCSGIFLSQNSGITNKLNWQIDIHNGHVLVYVHFAGYDTEKLKLAVEIIDTIHDKLDSIDINNELTISNQFLSELNTEFQYFIKQRDAVVTLIKNSQKEIITKLRELNLPNLDKFLSSKFASAVITSSLISCPYCEFTTKHMNGLNAHKCRNRPSRQSPTTPH